MTTNRTPAGVPTGGQFASTARTEAAVALGERPIDQAAQDWVLDRQRNGDGWLADPEALLALEEAAWDEEHRGGDPLEAYRREWRRRHGRFVATGDTEDAAFCVAIEREAEKRGAVLR